MSLLMFIMLLDILNSFVLDYQDYLLVSGYA